MLRDLATALSWLDARHRRRWAILVPLMILSALVEAVGALAVFGLLRLVVQPSLVRTAPVVSQLTRFQPGDDPAGVVALLAIFVAMFYLVRGLLLAATEWIRERAVHESAAQAAERLYGRYLAAPYPFHVQRASASLIEGIGRSAELAFQLGVAPWLHLLAEAFTVLALVLVLAINAPPVTLGAVAIILAIVAVAVWVVRRRWARLGTEEQALSVTQLHALQQSLFGIKAVIVSGRRSFFEERLRRTRRSLASLKEARGWMTAALRIGVETSLVLAMLLVVFLVMLGGTPGAETIAVLALFAYTGFRLVPSANRIMLNIGHLREGTAHVQTIARDFEALGPPPPTTPHDLAVTFTDRVELQHVSFAYEPGKACALRNVSLDLRHGEAMALVGPTGAGKSTLVNVLLGLLTPTEGRILVDGQPLAGRERGWQRLIGYVPQDVYLLDDTLRRNIAFGLSQGEIDEDAMLRAVAQARLDDVVEGLSSGLETMVGENGVRLSGGQRQRVAIARALYHQPPVLVFDEATAALDAQTEREVTAAITALHGARTLVVIAHRLTTVQACDRIVVLREGRVAAQGSHDELQQDAAFSDLK